MVKSAHKEPTYLTIAQDPEHPNPIYTQVRFQRLLLTLAQMGHLLGTMFGRVCIWVYQGLHQRQKNPYFSFTTYLEVRFSSTLLILTVHAPLPP